MIFQFFFGILDKTFVVVIKTCILTFLGINFEEECWIGKVLVFLCFGHWAIFFRSDSNIFIPRKRRVHSTYAEGFFWGTQFQKKVSSTLFGSLRKNCHTPGESFPAELSKLNFTLPEEQCGVCVFSEEIISSWFFRFWVKNSAISPNNFQ